MESLLASSSAAAAYTQGKASAPLVNVVSRKQKKLFLLLRLLLIAVVSKKRFRRKKKIEGVKNKSFRFARKCSFSAAISPKIERNENYTDGISVTPISLDGAEQQQWCACKFCFQLSKTIKKYCDHMDLHYLYSLRQQCGFPSQCFDVGVLPCFSACRKFCIY